MRQAILASFAIIAIASSPALAQDKGASGGAAAGAATGAVGGAIVGGPVGAAVGGAAGAVGGAVMGALTDSDKTYVRTYVRKHSHPSVRYEQQVVVGETLPSTVTYYRIEGRPELTAYEYAVVNDHTVLVDARSRKIVEVID